MEVIKLDDFPINPIQDQIYEIIPDKTKIVASTNRLFLICNPFHGALRQLARI